MSIGTEGLLYCLDRVVPTERSPDRECRILLSLQSTQSPAPDNSQCREAEIQLAEGSARDLVHPPPKPASEREKLEAAQKATSIALEDAAMAKEAMGQELALMQNQLSAVQAAQAASEADVQELRAALTAEKDRAFRAEVEVSELQGKLQMMDELEKELLKCKDMLENKDKKGSGGLWGYIAGA